MDSKALLILKDNDICRRIKKFSIILILFIKLYMDFLPIKVLKFIIADFMDYCFVKLLNDQFLFVGSNLHYMTFGDFLEFCL